MPSPRRPRLLVLLLTTLLAVPLGALLGVSPSYAAPGVAAGTVVDGFGDGLAGVSVTALEAPTYATGTQTTTTGAEGGYALTLSPGTYRLRFAKTDHETTFYGGGTGVDVVVDGDGDLSVGGEPVEDNELDDVTLPGLTAHAVTGRVRNAENQSLSGIEVDIFATGDDENPLDTATTGAAGTYSVEVPSGAYQLRYSDPVASYITAVSDEIDVTGPRALADVTLARPAANQEFSVAGGVVDENGDGVDGVTVELVPVGGSTDTGTTTTATVGGQAGLYSVDVRPGTYQVELRRTGWVTTRYGGAATPAVVTVAANGDLSVAPAEPLSGNRLGDVVLQSDPFTKTGTVRAAAGGAGISGITVRAFPEGSTDPADVVETVTSGAGGGYSIGLPVGQYDLELADNVPAAPTYTSATLRDVRIAQDGSLTVGGTPATTLPDVMLTVSSADTTHPVLGGVVDVTGADVDGLTVTAVPQGGSGSQATAQTGADGAFGDHGRYRLLLKPGDYLIEVDGGSAWADATYLADGTSPALVTVEANGTVRVNGVQVVGGALGDTEVKGTTTYALSGSVREGGTALVGITVTAYDIDDLATPVATTTSGTNGAWTLSGAANGLEVGTYAIELSGSANGTTYVRTYYGGATPTPVTMAQGGTALVAGSPLVPANTLPTVQLTRVAADQTYPVTGAVEDAVGDVVSGGTVTAVPQGSGTQASTTTGTDGRYRLELRPGTYRLDLGATGFGTTAYPGGGASVVLVTVQDGGTVLAGATPVTGDLDPVVLADATGDATVRGRVVSGGSPVVGITVEVFPEADFSGQPVASTTTLGNGTWSIATLKIETYSLRFTDTDGVAPTYVQTYFGGADAASALPVRVGQGNVVTVNGVPKTGGDLGDTAMTQASSDTTYPVIGAVGDANDDPLDGAAVTATPQGSGTAASTTTGADGALGDHGRYRLLLKPGTYRISFARSGFTGVTYDGTTVRDVVVQPGGAVLVNSVTMPGGELDGISLEQVTGSVAISGRAVNPGGTGLAGMTVTVLQASDTAGAAVISTTTGAGGAWSVGGLRIGTYALRFTGPGYDAAWFRTAAANPAEVKVAQGGQVFVDDALKAGGAIGDTTMSPTTATSTYPLRGSVADANGDPLQNVAVTAEAKGGGAQTATATTDADGEYTLMVRAGTYQVGGQVALWFPDYLRDADANVSQVVVTSNGVTVDGEPADLSTLDQLTLVSVFQVPVGGTVTDLGGAPVGGITVQAKETGGSTVAQTTTTAGNGTFTLQLRVGTYDIEFVDNNPAAPTYLSTFFGGADPTAVKVSQAQVVTDEAGTTLTTLGTVRMDQATATTRYDLRGVVYDENYDPLNGADVHVLPAGTTDVGRAVGTARTGVIAGLAPDGGGYSIPVPAGRYWLRYAAPGKQTTFLMDLDLTGPVTVTVAPNGTITAPDYEFVGNRIDDMQLLLPAPTVTAAPKLTGKVKVGEKVTTTFGSWSSGIERHPEARDFAFVEWFIDGKPADEYSSGSYSQSFKIPGEAAGRKISFRLTVEDPDGLRAAGVFDSRAESVPKAKAKLKATYKKGKLTVLVKVAGISKPLGTVKVLDGKKKLGSVKLKADSKGKAVLRLKGLKPGKHTLTIKYSGDRQVAPGKDKVKVKI